MSFQFAYIPIGVPTFHLESAQKAFDDSVSLLRAIDPDVRVPEEMLLSLDKLNAFLDTITPDFVIVQNVTFANAAYMSAVLRRFSCPVLLWTLREPVIDGGRLRLNSLTGAYSAANIMRACNRSAPRRRTKPSAPSARAWRRRRSNTPCGTSICCRSATRPRASASAAALTQRCSPSSASTSNRLRRASS